jgi:hypothetical protein
MTAMPKPNENFDSPDHALISGMVMGLAWKHGLELTPIIDEDSNYTPRYEVGGLDLPEGVHVFINVEAPTKDEKFSIHPTPKETQP